MKVFLAGTSLISTYGGPAYSVSQLAVALARAGVQVGVWAPDQSAPTTPLIPDSAGIVRLTGTETEALTAFGAADVLHDNGLWRPHNHRLAELAAARGIPRLVSTRGMLEPWALNHKRWKKRFAWWLYQRQDLKRAASHHVTAFAEARNVEARKLGVPVCVIPNGVDVPCIDVRAQGNGTESTGKTALFVGRIYPVKGLPMLVEAWRRVAPAAWRLNIVGPDEAGHRAAVEQAVVTAGLGGVVSFAGLLEGDAKARAFAEADLFVLPTHSESFGMAIAEALAHGLPVLTTTGAPWPTLAEQGCGWWVPPSVDGIENALRDATSLPRARLREMGAIGREFVRTGFGWDRIADRFVATYQDLVRDA